MRGRSEALVERPAAKAGVRSHDVVAAAYECGHEGACWRLALREIASYCDAPAAAIATYDFRTGERAILHEVGLRRGLVEAYAKAARTDNPWLSDEAAYRRAGSVHRDVDLAGAADLETSAFYRKFLRPQNLRHRLCLILENENAVATYLVLLRDARRSFTKAEMSVLQELAPHIVRAFQICRAQHAAKRLERAYRGTLDRLSFGVIFLDRDLRVQTENARARLFIEATSSLSVRRAQLRANDRRLEVRLRQAVEATMRGTPGASSVVVDDEAGFSQLILRVCVLPAQRSCDDPQLVLFLTESHADIRVDAQQLEAVFSLTTAEARLAARLVRGETLEHAAQSVGVSMHTARGYLKRVFLKTGVNRQVDLTRTVLPIALLEGAAVAPDTPGV